MDAQTRLSKKGNVVVVVIVVVVVVAILRYQGLCREARLHYISPSNLRSLLLLLLSLQLRDLCPYASKQGLIRPSPPRSRRDQSDHYFLNMVNPRAYC